MSQDAASEVIKVEDKIEGVDNCKSNDDSHQKYIDSHRSLKDQSEAKDDQFKEFHPEHQQT